MRTWAIVFGFIPALGRNFFKPKLLFSIIFRAEIVSVKCGCIPRAIAETMAFPSAVASTGPAITCRPEISAVNWHRCSFWDPPPTIWWFYIHIFIYSINEYLLYFLLKDLNMIFNKQVLGLTSRNLNKKFH